MAMAPMEKSLAPLIGANASSLTARLMRTYAVWWFETTFVTLPLGVAVQLHHSAALAVAAVVAGALWLGLALYMIVTHRRVGRAVRSYVETTYGFRPHHTTFRGPREAYGWLRLDQLYQAAGIHVTRVGTTKAYGSRWSRPRLIREMEAKLTAEGRSLPPALPIPGDWASL